MTDSRDGPLARQKTLPETRVEPRTLEVDALVRLDREVALVGLLQLLGGDAEEARVDVHEGRHNPLLARVPRPSGRGIGDAASIRGAEGSSVE